MSIKTKKMRKFKYDVIFGSKNKKKDCNVCEAKKFFFFLNFRISFTFKKSYQLDYHFDMNQTKQNKKMMTRTRQIRELKKKKKQRKKYRLS